MSRIFGLLVSVAIALCWPLVAAAAAPLRVYFLDVGQGDAVLIQSPTGQCVLHDGGDSPSKILAHLAAVNISQLDLVIASHNHADYIGGLAEVIRRFRPRYYLDNGVPATTLTYRRVLEAIEAAGTQLLEATPRQIRLGGEASLSVLPPPGIRGWDQDDNAVGVILTFGPFRLS